MARTKYEIEAIAQAILEDIHKENEKRIAEQIPKATRTFKEKYEPLLIEIDKLTDKVQKGIYGDKTSYGYNRTSMQNKEYFVRDIAIKLASLISVPRYEEIERQVILASSPGSDVVIKNVTRELGG